MSNLISNVPASMCLPLCRTWSAPMCILGALSVHLRYGLHTPALRLTIAVTDNRPKARFYIKLAPTSYRRDSHPLTQHALAWRTLHPSLALCHDPGQSRLGYPLILRSERTSAQPAIQAGFACSSF